MRTKKRVTRRRRKQRGGETTPQAPIRRETVTVTETETVTVPLTNKLVAPITNFLPNPADTYLRDVRLDTVHKNKIMGALMETWGVRALYEVEQKVRDAIHSLYERPEVCGKKVAWVPCSSTCQKPILAMIHSEIESTAYMLRTLAASTLSGATATAAAAEPLVFEVIAPLTGLWASDYPNIRISPRPGSERERGRLIMGFGPSASGKTHWAKTLIGLFSPIEGFPKNFITIDGGIYRESSLIYKAIVSEAAKVCVLGFSNLVNAGISIYKSLFQSDKIKKQMVAFLSHQRIPISLYVPETLGDCGVLKSCPKKYKEYIDITGDADWIGVLIWQHKTAAECKEDASHTCVGCTESGKAREVIEGKRYSNSAYSNSMYNGHAALLSEPGLRFVIHNCGRKDGRSILQDYTHYTPATQPFKDAIVAAKDVYAFDYSTA